MDAAESDAAPMEAAAPEPPESPDALPSEEEQPEEPAPAAPPPPHDVGDLKLSFRDEEHTFAGVSRAKVGCSNLYCTSVPTCDTHSATPCNPGALQGSAS